MNKKKELLAKYFADLSKIFLSAIVIKQFVEHKLNIADLIIGFLVSGGLILLAYYIQPKE
ncbi:MAG: hypothetical protein AB1349_11565 [Elusimicrobiota bacterium]